MKPEMLAKISTPPTPDWMKLAGAGTGRELMTAFAADKKLEREHEDSRC